MVHKVHFSSKNNNWQTPKWLFDSLNKIYNFNLDAAASSGNHLVSNYYTEEDDALIQDWSKYGSRVWCNPPYGGMLGKFVKKAFLESYKCENILLLIPARTDTVYWHDFCRFGSVVFIKGRLTFFNPDSPEKDMPAPFPSALVEFGRYIKPKTSYMTKDELLINKTFLYEKHC